MPGLQNSQPNYQTVLADFDNMTRNAARVQKNVLNTILQRNAATEYLQTFALDGQIDADTFKHYVPVVTHSDLQPYLQRIADGDKSPILTATPVEMMSLSSGTTNGHQKYLPFCEEIKAATLEVGKIAAACRASVFPIRPGGRILEFKFCGKMFATKGGLRAGTVTTHLFRSDTFKLREKGMNVRACSPDEVVYGSDCRQAMYCHLLCGLLYSEVECLSAIFAYTLVEALRTFELEWHHLCEDIQLGSLSDRITDPSIRAAVSKLLRPNPDLANKIASKCRELLEDDWYGVIPELWPRCKYVHSIMTGAMEPYVQRLQHYAKKLPLVSADYGATEGWIAVNINPRAPTNNVSFTVIPSLAYFEFIPLYRPKSSDVYSLNAGASTAAYEEGDPVELTEVEVGQEYEIVMTTFGGLYRYRLGDVVRVTGFFNTTPQFAYVCRKNVLLSINIDKNTEKDLTMVIGEAAKKLAEVGTEVVDYTSYADRSTKPGHYKIFMEVGGKQPEEGILEECAKLMDMAFIEPGYVTSRKMATIGGLELCIVKRGSFSELLDCYMQARGAPISQYKTPRCIVAPDLLSALSSRVCSTYHSVASFH